MGRSPDPRRAAGKGCALFNLREGRKDFMKEGSPRILIIDGQGGRIGRQLIEALLPRLPDARITAVGTNSAATASMLKGGAHQAATGENAVVVGCRRADIIAGPIGIVIADALLGEITPAMAAAVGSSPARKVLLPMERCDVQVAGVEQMTVSELLQRAVELICPQEQ